MVFQHSAWPQSRPGDINMTTPWKYTGQSTPRGKGRTYTWWLRPAPAACTRSTLLPE